MGHVIFKGVATTHVVNFGNFKREFFGNMSRLHRSSPPVLDAHREKAMRSVFVANISFETTEEEMRAVLSEVINN